MMLNKKLDEASNTASAGKRQLQGPALVGKTVSTTYGKGVVLECREEDQYVYVIKFLKNEAQSDYDPVALLYTREVPTHIKTPEEAAAELNIAYEAQEKMRRMNLEMQFFGLGIKDVQHDECTTCLLYSRSNQSNDGPQNRFPRLQKFVDNARDTAEHASATAAAAASKASSKHGKNFPRLRKLWGKTQAENTSANEEQKEQGEEKGEPSNNEQAAASSKKSQRVVLPRIQKMLDERQKASATPCLICGNPVCSQHTSSNYKKEGITLCQDCERLFELDFIIECVSTPDPSERAKRIDHMVDCYDRCLLLLKYSTQYVDQIALSLEQRRQQQNKVGLGSSGVGVLSGVLGIAAAATILTPAGSPLLIASLFFGGGATAVQTGTEAFNHFSEPNKLADRIIALHGMVFSILRVTSTLRDAMLRDHIRTDVFDAEKVSLTDAVQGTMVKNKAGVLVASNMGRAATLGSVAGAEAGVVASASTVVGAEVAAGAGARGATALSRAGTAAARSIRFARFAGGALSAAVLLIEANALHSTIKEIHNGSPCEKAQYIRAIAAEVQNEDLPSTSELDEECQAYLAALASRPMPPQEVAAEEATGVSIQDFPEAECAVADANMGGRTGALIVGGEEVPLAAIATPAAAAAASGSQSHSSFLGSAGSSLFQSMNFQRQVPTRGETSSLQSGEIFASAGVDDRRNPRDSELNLVL